MLHVAILNGVSIGSKNPCLDSLREYLERGYWVYNSFNIWKDTPASTEGLPLFPGGGVFPEGGSGKSFGNRFVCTIVIIQCLNAQGIRHKAQTPALVIWEEDVKLVG